VAVNRRRGEDRDPDGTRQYQSAATMQAVSKPESGDTGRYHQPEHKSMKVLTILHGNGGDWQYRHEYRHCQAMHQADRRKPDRNPVEVSRNMHERLVSVSVRADCCRGGEDTPLLQPRQLAGIVTYVP
jgi:hypothetical protein